MIYFFFSFTITWFDANKQVQQITKNAVMAVKTDGWDELEFDVYQTERNLHTELVTPEMASMIVTITNFQSVTKKFFDLHKMKEWRNKRQFAR